MELFSENRIVELEEKIGNLIASYKNVKEEKEKLLHRLQSLGTENKELKEKMVEVKNEREVLIEKVTKILEKIEKVEV
jgi:septal ring factor EnvC (AmiA/AmiB activator)